jgi:Fe-S cluster assembly protein SufD
VSALLDSLADGFAALALPDAQARRALLDAALAHELPTQRVERWKYTPLRALASRRFRPAQASDRVVVDASLIAHIPAPRLVFVNGQFDAALSATNDLPVGVELESSPAPVAADVSGARNEDAFARLNAAFANEGARLTIADGIAVAAPFHWVFVGAPTEGDIAVHSRHAIALGRGAKATLVEHHLAAGANAHLGNHRLRIALDEAAGFAHVRIQDEAPGANVFAATDATLATDADYRRVDLELGAALSRHEFGVVLAGERARLHSGGALAASGRRHLDTRLNIVHAARDTRCDLLWRGAAAGRSRVVFHGGIRIDAGADGAAAALSNKNLLLSEHAEIDAQPVLEIHADEVTASHGATVGRLDPTQLFYLRTRGIGEEQARAILTAAFGRAALAPLGDDALVEPLAERLRERLSTLDAA